MDRLSRDIRQALRTLRVNPGFATLVVTTLAVGIGANTAIFSVVNGLLLRPLPYPAPHRLVQVWETDPRQGSYEGVVSPLNLADWREASSALSGFAAYGYAALTLTGGQELPERTIAATVSASFFSVLGVEPSLGRDFLPEEDQPGLNDAVILSHGYWRRRFGADMSIIGRTIALDGRDHTIVGVMPEFVRFPGSAEIWRPLGLDHSELSRGQHFLFAIGRLEPGVSLAAAQSELDEIARRLQEAYPDTNGGKGVRLVPLQEQLVADVRTPALTLLGAVGLVLLIGCANVANLFLVRASSRQRETAVRAALGASRFQLVRAFLTESVFLAVLAGGLGIFLALWGLQLLTAVSSLGSAELQRITVDGRVLAFTAAISVATGLLFGLAPAVQFSAPKMSATLKEGARTLTDARGRALRRGLVIAEVALALTLLVSAGLLARSFLQLTNVDPGFEARNVITARIRLPESRYADPAGQWQFSERLLERLRGDPTVEAVALVDDLPFSGSRSSSSFDMEGSDLPEGDAILNTDVRRVTPDYFSTMGIPLLRGRGFSARDHQGSPGVVAVNAAFVQRYFPGRDAIGQRISLGGAGEVALYGEPVWRQIVAVVGDIKHDNLAVPSRPEAYIPMGQLPSTRLFVVFRTGEGAPQSAALVRSAVQEVDPGLAVFSVQPMEQRLVRSIALPRFNAQLLGGLAVIALVLAAIGVYGVVSYTLVQRTREIGIRMALGAEPDRVVSWLIGGAMRDILFGLAIGIAAALLAGRALRGLLFGIRTTDPLTFVAVIVVLSLAALLACWVPAKRATRVDPVRALRQEL